MVGSAISPTGIPCPKLTIECMKKELREAIKWEFDMFPAMKELDKTMKAEYEEEQTRKKEAEWAERRRKDREIIYHGIVASMNDGHKELLSRRRSGGDDVTGTWQFNCPEAFKRWQNPGSYGWPTIQWIIHPHTPGEDGRWCSFHHIVSVGVLWIKWDPYDLSGYPDSYKGFTFRGRDPNDDEALFCNDEI